MSGPGWAVIALLAGAPLIMAGRTWRARRRRTLMGGPPSDVGGGTGSI
ncbi:hypothetical protein [Micromonospora inositola]|nr:hypothetical protein [Micromonospora inositola]